MIGKNQSGMKPIKPLRIGVRVGIIETTLRAIRAGLDRGAVNFHFALRGNKMEVRCYMEGRWQVVAHILRRVSMSIVSRLKIMGNLSIAEKRLIQTGTISSSERHPPFLIVAVPTDNGAEEIYLTVRTT